MPSVSQPKEVAAWHQQPPNSFNALCQRIGLIAHDLLSSTLETRGSSEDGQNRHDKKEDGGDRRFVCKTCPKKYKRKKHLKRHVEAKHLPVTEQPLSACGICLQKGIVKTFVYSDDKDRHIEEAHTGTAIVLVSGESVTYSRRQHYLNRAHSKPGLEEDDGRIVDLAISFPRNKRRTGGFFTEGPLGGKGFKPGSNAFNSRGELQPHYPRYNFIQEKLPQKKSRPQPPVSATPVPSPLRRSSRECNKNKRLILPPSFYKESGPTRPAIEIDTFTKLRANFYEPQAFTGDPETPRKRPKNWPKELEWPENPTAIPNGEQGCDYCLKMACDCITQLAQARRRLRVINCGEKGDGMVAAGARADKKNKGAVFNKDGKIRVFKADTIVSELTGRLVPDDPRFDDGRSVEIRREDLPGAPVLGRIHCWKEGNVIRYVNHDCENNSEIFWSRFSGKYRLCLRTLKDVFDGEELTVSYGPEFFTEEDPCKCSSKKCVFAREDVSKTILDRAIQKHKAMDDRPATGRGGKRARVKDPRKQGAGEESISARKGQKRKAVDDDPAPGPERKMSKGNALRTPLGPVRQIQCMGDAERRNTQERMSAKAFSTRVGQKCKAMGDDPAPAKKRSQISVPSSKPKAADVQGSPSPMNARA